jgi:hypothetical protein
MRRLKPTGDPQETYAWVVEDEFDRVHALGGATGGRAAETDKLGEFRAQRRMQLLQEPHGDPAAFARRQELAPEELMSRPSVRAMVGDIVRRAPRSAQPGIRALAAQVNVDQ